MSLRKLLFAACLCWGFPGHVHAEVMIKDGDSIAFLGDSLTAFGWSQKPNGYINLVVEGLKQAGINAVPVPAGVGGNTTTDMLARLDTDVIAKKPVWMTLNSGINDTPKLSVEQFASNIAQIVDRAQAAGIKVILMTTTIAAGERLDNPDNQKRLLFCEEFRKLAKAKNLVLVDLNVMMAGALTELKKDGVPGLHLTFDGTHLNGLGNQLVAAEILKTLGVSETDLATLRKRWDDYPRAVAMPEVSVRDYLKLKAAADQSGKSVDDQVTDLLTSHAEEKK